MKKLNKSDARKIMALYSTLVITGVISTDEFLDAMMLIEEYVGLSAEYISTWGPYLHMYDLVDDDDDE